MGAGEGANVMYNKEKMAEYHKKWYEANKEKMAEYQRKYREANKEKSSEYNRKWREANKEYNKKWREANKEKVAKHEIVKNYKRYNGFAPPAEYVEVKYIINKTNNFLKQKVS